MEIIESIKDKWLTWRTGKDKSQRDYEAWYHSTVNIRASTIEEYFANFKYVFQVNPNKFLVWHMFVDTKDDMSEYRYPQRALGDNMIWTIQRGEVDYWTNQFTITDFGDEDRVYIATNNEADATLLALKYS